MGRIKNIDEIKAELRAMTGKSKIFRRAKIEDVESVIGHLTSKDPELWAAQWSRVAKRYEDTGAQARTGRTPRRGPRRLYTGLYLLCHRSVSGTPYSRQDAVLPQKPGTL